MRLTSAAGFAEEKSSFGKVTGWPNVNGNQGGLLDVDI